MEAGALSGPVMVPRDWVFAATRYVGEDAFFLAEYDTRPAVAPTEAEVLGHGWFTVAPAELEPPELWAILSRLRSAAPSPRSR